MIAAPPRDRETRQAAVDEVRSGSRPGGPRRHPEAAVAPESSTGGPAGTEDFSTLHGQIVYPVELPTTVDAASNRRPSGPEGGSANATVLSHGAADRAELTLSSLGEGILRLDAAGRIEYMNPAAVGLCGREHPAGYPLASSLTLLDERTRQELPNIVAVALAERRPVETGDAALMLRPDGTEVSVRGSVQPLLDDTGSPTGAVLVLRDAARARALVRELEFLARHDPLTGLVNRREFERQVSEAICGAAIEHREHALLYIDLDQFKLVNDTSGHLAGDDMLRQIAQLLASRLRRRDCLARLGGDEFGALLFDCQPEAANEIANELRLLVHGFRFEWEGHAFDIGASIGLVPIHAGSGDLTDVLRAADAACYVVKDAGGNGVHQFSLDDTAIGRRQTEMFWVQRVQRAYDEDRLRLHYQMIEPLADPGAGAMCELFLRLVDHDGTLHTAGSFVPAAERFGLMVQLDRWVVRRAFRAIAESIENDRTSAAHWKSTVESFAINLSAHSLSSPDFLDFVLDEISASGIQPERVCFEITETAAIRNLAHARRLISALKGVGCRFALDDFGRGLSSFAYLKDLEVDLLKIDGDFTRGLAGDSVNRALVASIHQIGKVMGLATIAEGVEDAGTLSALAEIGVEYAQGNLLHRPAAVVRD
jgi:diguanylate cyclase (GGDEF)-like protein